MAFRLEHARLLEKLGTGATSSVWLAEDQEQGVTVALKIGADLGQRQRLADEGQRLLLADSPQLAAILGAGFLPSHLARPDWGLQPGLPLLILEWVPGQALDRLLALPSSERAALALEIACQIGRALDDLHSAGLAHGDVKPANIVVEQDGAGGRSAKLVDLGLAGSAHDAELRGASLRYLAPEALVAGEGSDARARDLYAFGFTLAELLEPTLTRETLSSATWDAALPEELVRIVRALTAENPNARPSCRWVAARAALALGLKEPEAAAEQRRCRAVRRAYLGVRVREIQLAARARPAEVLLEGSPAAWVRAALAIQAQVEAVADRLCLADDPKVIRPLSAFERARWLTTLIGTKAVAWSLVEALPEHELASRALALCKRREPAAWSLGDLDGSIAQPASNDDEPVRDLFAIALELGKTPCSEGLLDAAEALVLAGDAPLALGLELGRQLRRRGHYGRALGVLQRFSSSLARVEAAEVSRRAGDLALARQLLEGELAPESTQRAGSAAALAVAVRRAAILARLLLEEGQPVRALELLENAPDGLATLEVRALVELALGRRLEARSAIARAEALAQTDEEQARVLAALGFISHHADGDYDKALTSFRRAAEHAARAGAVLEEATYLTSVAAAAPHVGEFGEGLAAAQRSELLFECLGKLADTARATLSRAAVYVEIGNLEEAREAANVALARARLARDRRCEAFAHLTLSDVLPLTDPAGRDHLERSRLLLSDAGADDQLRLAARLLRRQGAVDVAHLDVLAHDASVPIDVRLEWWAARAQVETASAAPVRPDAVLAELSQLATERSPVAVRGAALARGVELATRVSDGDSARRLALAVGDAARELIRKAPPEMKASVLGLEWVNLTEAPREDAIHPQQVAEIETLVRSLGQRDRLRPLLDRVLDALVLWTGVERGLLLLRAPGGRLVSRAARNLTGQDLKGLQLELSHSLAERALTRREPVVAVDAAGDLPEVHASVHALKLRSVLAVPLIAHGEVLGVVYLDDRVRRGAFGARELAWVRLVATIAAVAIADARDQLLLRRAARRAERAEARLARELAQREARLDVAERELAQARSGRETRFSYASIVGESPAIRRMLAVVDRVTLSEVPVLVVGESGSGKELVARAIHENGVRGRQPFVCENCASVPESLLESTLFGHTRGAFTGAVRPRAGLFEVADGGTLFLDEVAEMSLGMQSKLLRVLQDGEIHPVGAARERRVDVRVIGATHKDLAALVAQGKFREDLFYRLNVISISVPALRERGGDIPRLVQHFVKRYAAGQNRRVSPLALKVMSAYRWPGNIRQLENEVRRALVLADEVIEVEHLSQELLAKASSETSEDEGLNVRRRVDSLEFNLVNTALARTGGNQTRAAELLGLSRFGLQKMIKRLGIRVEQTVPSSVPLA